MNRTLVRTSLTLAFGFTVLSTQAATLITGDRLSINSGAVAYDITGNITAVSGSWFAFDLDNNGIGNDEKTAIQQGTEGIIIGIVQATGVPSHSGSPTASDWNRIDAPWSFLGATGMHFTSLGITGGAGGLNMSGWNWVFNGAASTNLGSSAWGAGFTSGVANFAWDGVYGHGYTLDYHATASDGAFTGGLAPYALHLEGSVQPVPIPAAGWLLGSGILGLLGAGLSKRNTKA